MTEYTRLVSYLSPCLRSRPLRFLLFLVTRPALGPIGDEPAERSGDPAPDNGMPLQARGVALARSQGAYGWMSKRENVHLYTGSSFSRLGYPIFTCLSAGASSCSSSSVLSWRSVLSWLSCSSASVASFCHCPCRWCQASAQADRACCRHPKQEQNTLKSTFGILKILKSTFGNLKCKCFQFSRCGFSVLWSHLTRFFMLLIVCVDIQDLLRRMLKLDPNERASIPEIFNHSWLRFRNVTSLDNQVDQHI